MPTAKILLTSAYPDYRVARWLMTHALPTDRSLCTSNPEEADVILFAEGHPGSDPYFWRMYSHPLFRRYPEKCVLYHDADQSATLVPTLSPSVERWQYKPNTSHAAHYVARVAENKAVDSYVPRFNGSRRYLASFLGSSQTHAMRRDVHALRSQEIYTFDPANRYVWEVSDKQRNAFVDVTDQSHFVLCPRGIGPSTYRLFEVMQMGRAPVIISDQWVPISGLDWSAFSIQIPEADVRKIPEILSAQVNRSADMGCVARAMWEKHFSPAVSLRTITRLAFELKAETFRWTDALFGLRQFKRNDHFRGALRAVKFRLIADDEPAQSVV